MVFLGQKLFCCKNGRNISHLVHLDALITNPSFNFGVRCCLVSWGGKHPLGGDRQKQTNYTSSSTHLDADYESQIYFGIRWRLRGLGIFFTFVASHGARSVQFFLTVWDFSKMTPPVTPRRGTPTSSILFWKEDTLAVVLRKDGRDVTLPPPPPLVSLVTPFSNHFLGVNIKLYLATTSPSCFESYGSPPPTPPPHMTLGYQKYVVFQTFPFQEHLFFKRGLFHPISPKRKHLRTRELQIWTPGLLVYPLWRNLGEIYFWVIFG